MISQLKLVLSYLEKKIVQNLELSFVFYNSILHYLKHRHNL